MDLDEPKAVKDWLLVRVDVGACKSCIGRLSLPGYWLYTLSELIVSAIDDLKMMAGGHAVCNTSGKLFIDHDSHIPYI